MSNFVTSGNQLGLNLEVRNNIAEKKGTMSKMRNMLDGMNSRMEEAEEQLGDLEDRVMESNQAELKREKKNNSK